MIEWSSNSSCPVSHVQDMAKNFQLQGPASSFAALVSFGLCSIVNCTGRTEVFCPCMQKHPYTSSEQDLKLPLCFEEQVWVPSPLAECSTGATFVPRCTIAVKQATEPQCVCSIILHAPSFSVISRCACIQLW
jgi:hypothetical protein